METLFVGKGGSEHTLAYCFAQSPLVTGIYCAPGNPGMADERLKSNGKPVVCVPIDSDDIYGLRDFAIKKNIGLTVIRPEKTLALGATDLFEEAKLLVFGPNKRAARFEWSKCFAQKFAERHSLPFATGECFGFSERDKAKAYAKSLFGFCVVKKDELADGKGAFPCRSLKESYAVIDAFLGEPRKHIVIQELLDGFEVSLQILCDDKNWKLLSAPMDYKRLNDGNEGPMTGGMGSCLPHPFVSIKETEEMAHSIMEPFLKGCQKEGIEFRGLLYPGIIVTTQGFFVIEFNARFGDPEAQVVVPSLKTDLAELLLATAEGRLNEVSIEFHQNRAVVCVVIVAPGYPENPVLGKKITGSLKGTPNLKIFHAGTRLDESDSELSLVTSGGRVLGVTAWNLDHESDDPLDCAKRNAYGAVSRIKIEGGFHVRNDIARKVL